MKIIEVKGISKKYLISHQKQRGRYTALRDVLTNSIKNLFSKKRKSSRKEEFWALKDITFDVIKGDKIGIIGRNGAGKSTLLKILSRITEPTEGKVKIKGRVASLLEVGTGFHPELTGRENIYLNGSILGMRKEEIKRKFDEIVEFSEIEKFLDTPVKRYSSGMYVRLAFSVAAHLEPEILLVDEVLAVGDAQFQKKCLGKMEEVSKEGRTVLFVSHNMGTIMQLCDKCILLNEGQIERMGKPVDIIKHYQSTGSNTFVGKNTTGNDIYIKKIDTYNENGMTSIFAQSEAIKLRITIGINLFKQYQNIGVVLKTNDKRRVFTVNKALSDLANPVNNEITIDFIIDGGLIAPMYYSFLVALNTQRGDITYEMQDDICPIRVMDDGTKYAFAEGYDYGCILLKDRWEIIEII